MTSLTGATLLRRIADRGRFPVLYRWGDDFAAATDGAQILALRAPALAVDDRLFEGAARVLGLAVHTAATTVPAAAVQHWAGYPPRIALEPCGNWRETDAHLDIEECDCSWVPGLGWVEEVPSRNAEPAVVYGAHFDRTRIAELVSPLDEAEPLTLWREGDALHLVADGYRAALMRMDLPEWPRKRGAG